ncbi:MAG TPA: alpha/beta hydrolase [Opitutaceae bacterium]|nr:alpha/beta hydrolase [Opitutaceae bacterium]
MRHLLSLFSLFVLAVSAAGAAPTVIPLWENGAPGFESRRTEPEEAKDYWVRNIHNPSLTVFPAPAAKANGCAVIVAPGGGYRELVFHAEGEQVAEFLNPLGVTVFVLKYRLPQQEGSPYAVAQVREDALRAVRSVRSRAAEFGVDPHRIGFLGFSAGGAVAMIAGFEPSAGDAAAVDPIERTNSRPDFMMLVYPGGILYPGGALPKTLPADVPPVFLLCANDDEYGCDASTIEVMEKYRAAGVPVELHLLARGKHAFNMGDRSELRSVRTWPQRLADWLADSGYMRAGSAER